MLNKVKTALRLTTTAYDDELQDLINACKADLGLTDIYTIQDDDVLIIRCVILYCKMYFGTPNDTDSKRLKQAYDELKGSMLMSSKYTDWQGQGGGDMVIDSALSTTSTNAVQNKVIAVALENAVAQITANANAIENKVDKETGKGLSTNDFTTALKNKLDGIQAGAEINDIKTVKVNGSPLIPDSEKAVSIQTMQMMTDDHDNSIYIDDGSGNNTFSVTPTPDGAYLQNVIEQNTTSMHLVNKEYADNKSVYVLNLSTQDQVIEDYTDILAARAEKRDFILYGSGGNPTKVTGLFLQKNGTRNFIRLYGWFSFQLRYWDVYEDGTKSASTVLEVIEDTGWQTLTGDYFDINYRKKNGVVYVAWHQTSGVKQALTAKTPVTNCTLPAGFRPSRNSYTMVIAPSAWNHGYVGIQTGGAMRVCFENAIAQGAETMFGSLCYPA